MAGSWSQPEWRKALAADVRGGLLRAPLAGSSGVRANRPSTAPEVAEHDDVACAVISAELVACTLGQRQRLELRVDPAGRIAHLIRQSVVWVNTAAPALIRELAAYTYPRRAR